MQELVKLETYQGEFQVSKKWLLNYISPNTINDFLNCYTWDESEWIFIEYSIYQTDLKIKDFILLLKEGKKVFKRGIVEGIVHTCTYKNYKYQFSYFDGYGAIGDIQKNSIEEIAKSIVEYGFEPCNEDDLKFIN
jgi:hypothetical protein